MKIMDPASLVEAIEGPRLSIPLALVLRIGNLAAAAFLAQAAYLSSLSKNTDGWFDLPQLGEPKPDSQHLWGKLGSWAAILGIGVDAQSALRQKLRLLGLLEERRQGIPARLQYRVRSDLYLAYLAGQPYAPINKPDSGKTRIETRSKPLTRTGGRPSQVSVKPPNQSIDPALDISLSAAFKKAAASSANNQSVPGKRYRPRPSGIATWLDSDEPEASRVEANYAASDIAAAVKAINARTRADGGKQYPVPGTVELEIQRMAAEASCEGANEQLSDYVDKRVLIAGYSIPVRIRRVSSGFYGEVEGRNAGIAHPQLVEFAKRGAISPCPEQQIQKS